MHPVHLNLDDAWGPVEGFETLDLRHWGPKLRYHGRNGEVEEFYSEFCERFTPLVLYGSGDFHYLTGVLLRKMTAPVAVICFDNHPDWDIRPPHWSCGGWVNRALELPQVKRVCVWGCGNFELSFPSRLFANRKALRSGRLDVHAWAERQPPGVQRRFNRMTRQNWKDEFEQFAKSLASMDVYVSIDLDCLTSNEASTNWENGLFTARDVAWALEQLHSHSRVVAGDVCGAYSPPCYARWFQRFAGNWDHPKITNLNTIRSREINLATLRAIWPALSAFTPSACGRGLG